MPADELAVGERPSEGLGTGGDSSGELLVLLRSGWERGRSYRVRLTPALTDRLGRGFGRSESLEWSVPPATAGEPLPAIHYDQRFAPSYESWQAAGATLGGRFPAGQSRLFQGLWADPVTGLSYARARWYDSRSGVFVTEDPMADLDSPNLYAFGAWAPSMHTDPTGEFVPQLVGGTVSVLVGAGLEAAINLATGDDSWDYSWTDAGVDFALGAATVGLSNVSKLRHVSKLRKAGQVGVRATAEISLDFGAEVTRRELKGEDWTLGELAFGAGRNFLIGEVGSFAGRRAGETIQTLARRAKVRSKTEHRLLLVWTY